MNIRCEIDEVMLTNDEGYSVRSTLATCTRCGNEEESFGTSEGSVMRCLILLRESCPGGKRHFYVTDDDDRDDGDRGIYENNDPTCCFTSEGLALQVQIEATYRGDREEGS